MSKFGLAPFGTDRGPFGGPGLITILGVIPVGINEVIVVFDAPPKAYDSQASGSASNAKSWQVVPIDPRVVSTADPTVRYPAPPGEVVPSYTPAVASAVRDSDDPTQIHVYTQGPMEERARYELRASPAILGRGCEVFAGVDAWPFRAPRRGPERRARYVQEDRHRDWAFEHFPADPNQPEGTWRHDENGDIGIHDGFASLKKRLLRRIGTTKGHFAHMPNYGITPTIKRLALAGQVQALANEVSEQAREEPDVTFAATEIEVNSETGLLDVRLSVVTRQNLTSRFLFSLPGV